MFKRITLALLVWLVSVQSASAQVVPSYSKALQTFGDYTNSRPAPTTGTLTGTYKTAGPWVQTGTITCNACRLFFGSTVTINAAFNAAMGVEANDTGQNSTPYTATAGGNGSFQTESFGQGLGGGQGQFTQNFFGVSQAASTGGGGHCGAGGAGTEPSVIAGGKAYTLDVGLQGSGAGFPGGKGGGGLYIEAGGNVTFTNTAVVNCNGEVGIGGGSGGGFDCRSLRNINVNAGAVISANGANGTAGGGGGGGGVSLMPGPTGTAVNNGTITVSGGIAGAGVNGSIGTTSVGTTFTGSRCNF